MSPMVYPCPYKSHESVDHTSRVCGILYRFPFEKKKRVSLGHMGPGLCTQAKWMALSSS